MTTANITKLEGSAVTNKFNDANSVTHPNPTTFFSSNAGVGKAFIEARFDEETEINNVTVSFQRGKERRTCFAILTIDNKENYKRVEPNTLFVSSGESLNRQDFTFKKTKAIGIRLVFLGNADNEIFNERGEVKDINRINNFGTIQRGVLSAFNTVDVGVNKQIFTVRKLSVSYDEVLEDQLKESLKDEKVDKKEDLPAECKCDCCDCCGNTEKSKIKDGVCQVCKNLCHINENKLKREFPFAWSYSSNAFLFSDEVGRNSLNQNQKQDAYLDNNDRGIKSAYRVNNNNAVVDPSVAALGHINHSHRDNYTVMNPQSALRIPQERKQEEFTNTGRITNNVNNGYQISNGNGERLDRIDVSRNVNSAKTPSIYVPTGAALDKILADRKATDAYREGRPNGDLNINKRDVETSNKGKGQSSSSSDNNNKSVDLEPEPINKEKKKQPFKASSNDTQVKITAEQSPLNKPVESIEPKKESKIVTETDLDPNIAKTFDDFLNDKPVDSNDMSELTTANATDLNEFPDLTDAASEIIPSKNQQPTFDEPNLPAPIDKDPLIPAGKADLDNSEVSNSKSKDKDKDKKLNKK